MDLVNELIEIYPEALDMRDSDGFPPLLRCLTNRTPEAPDILQALVDAAPQTASQIDFRNRGMLPLHFLLIRPNKIPDTSTERMVSILLRAFPEAVNIPDCFDMLPIHYAARSSNATVMKVLMEANPGYELDFHVACQAASIGKWDNLTYIYSIKPELFTDYPLLHVAIKQDSCDETEEVDFTSILGLLALSPEAARVLDKDGNNLLHSFIDKISDELNDPAALSTLLVLLRLIPGATVATNIYGETPYDYLDPDNPDHFFARRLLLLARAPY